MSSKVTQKSQCRVLQENLGYDVLSHMISDQKGNLQPGLSNNSNNKRIGLYNNKTIAKNVVRHSSWQLYDNV